MSKSPGRPRTKLYLTTAMLRTLSIILDLDAKEVAALVQAEAAKHPEDQEDYSHYLQSIHDCQDWCEQELAIRTGKPNPRKPDDVRDDEPRPGSDPFGPICD